ncbi:hypothetical protein, partial [Streptomyces chiangmaiensis]
RKNVFPIAGLSPFGESPGDEMGIAAREACRGSVYVHLFRHTDTAWSCKGAGSRPALDRQSLCLNFMLLVADVRGMARVWQSRLMRMSSDR